MSNSINTNIAALFAQANISAASNAASASVARLSSGNRIVQASDDVAALATGTSLQTQVSALKAALTNASQGSSLLQVADGALQQIQNILQQQQAIALQAASGSLTNVDRGFLNQQFQALSNEINSLTSSTTFNGVSLIDGSIAGQIGVTSNATASVSGLTTNTSGNIFTFANGPAVDGDTVTVNGVTVTFTTATPGTAAAAGKVQAGVAIADTAANLAAFLNASAKPQFANLEFVASGANVLAHYAGGSIFGNQTITASANLATPANVTTANGTIGATSAGNIAKNSNGLSIDRVGYSGSVTGTLLTGTGDSATNSGAGIDLSTVFNNAAFIGAFPTLSGTYSGTADQPTFSVTVGDITYTSNTADIATNAKVTLTFTGVNNNTHLADGGTFKLVIDGNTLANNSINNQNDVDTVVTRLNDSLSGVTVNQTRTVTSFTSNNVASVGGVQVANLQNVQASLHGSDFDNINLQSITVESPGFGSTDATFTAVINGETYKSVAGIGNQIGLNTTIALQNVDDPTKVLALTTGNIAIASSTTTAWDISNSANADALTTALRHGFGLDQAGASLTFQIGSSSDNTVGVTIGSARTSALFNGATLDVSTQVGATAASTAVGNAINTVTALRSGVGALESQFNFASAALSTSVQNQDAARGLLLDTDIAAESTSFATSQVKLQAGISVLAQANQQLQALLKLIG